LRIQHGAAPLATAAMIAITAATLGGCSSALYQQEQTARTGSVRAATLRAMDKLNMDRAAPVLVRIYKEESTLEVWKQNRTGRFALLTSYPICKYSGNLGPKIEIGDHQAPEGFYDVTPDQMNPMSTEYLSFNTGFPNAYDRSLGRTGNFLMVHGGCASVGCYAMTDPGIEEIYGLVDEAFKGGQEKVQLQAFPFRMTAQNIARHAGDPNVPFWEMLRTGSDAFHANGRPPTVAVCERRYVFNPGVIDDNLDPSGPCPPGFNATPQGRMRAASLKGPSNAVVGLNRP
jgi:murein L,D-transpeptidase YafK